MATVAKVITLFVVLSSSLAVEPEQNLPDTLAPDTTIVALLDSTTTISHSATSGWLIPLAILGATAGVFVILFSARTKS